PIRTTPPEISSSPATIRKAVVLPQPDGPTRTMNSPSATSRSSESTALMPSAYTFVTSSRTTSATAPPRARAARCQTLSQLRQVRGLGPAGIALDDAVRLAVVGEELEERVRRERLRAEHARSLPGACGEQLERDHRVDRGLEDDGLVPVLAHRPLVVGDVVEVDGAVASVLALAGDERAGAGLAAHPVAERRRIREGGRHDVPGRDLDAANANGLRRVEPELVQRLEDVDELRAEPVLERHAAAVDLARHEHDLLVLDVDALDHADPLRELEQLRLGERLGRVEAALLLPDQRRVQALLDRRPDREGRR